MSCFDPHFIIDALADNGYVVLDDAIPGALAEGQQLFAQLQQADMRPAGIGRGQAQRVTEIRSDKIAWLANPEDSVPIYSAAMESLRQAANRAFYLGLFDFECHFARYDAGDFYQKHLDAFRGQSNRRLSSIYYLNDDWRTEDGGELLVYQPDDDTQVCQRVLPKGGRLVVFFSEQFAHEVLPAKRARASLTGWFRVRDN